MPHTTLAKFGYPELSLHEGHHWCVLLRRTQVTLGSLILVCKEDAMAFSAISRSAFAELPIMIQNIETAMPLFRSYDKINYLMLMMVDPHVHFHVFPRYPLAQSYGGYDFPDTGWPGPPQLQSRVMLDSSLLQKLKSDISINWPAAAV